MPKKSKRKPSAPDVVARAPEPDAVVPPDVADEEPAVPSERWWMWVAVVAIAAGTVLRFWDLGGKSLWFDEALSLDDSKSLAVKFGSGFHPPLFYFLLHAWARFAGSSDAVMRLVAAIPGALTLPAVFLAARRMFGTRAGAFAVVTLAIASLHLEYSQEVRMYALATFFVALATWLLAEAVAREDATVRTKWLLAIGYTVSAYAAMATHYLAAFVVLAQAIALVLAWRTTRPLVLRLAALQIPAILGALTILLTTGYLRKVRVAADFFVNMGGVNQTIFSDVGERFLGLPKSLFLQVFPGFNLKWLVIAAYRWFAVGSFDVLAVAGLVALARRAESSVANRVLAIVPALLPLPLIVLMVGPEQLRFYVVVAPVLALAVGAGLAAIKPRPLGVAALAVVVVTSSLACWWYFAPGMDKQPWRPVANLIDQQCRAGDVVLVNEPHLIIAFERYWVKRPGVDVEPYPEVGGARINPDDLDRWFFPLIRDRSRVWFVRMAATASHSDPDELALKWLASNMHLVSRISKPGYNGDISVLLFEK